MASLQPVEKIEQLRKPYFVWFEAGWKHEEEMHKHSKAQLIYVQSGFQYVTIRNQRYLLPQNHIAWIPPEAPHQTGAHSQCIDLRLLFFQVEDVQGFYGRPAVFPATELLRQMIGYAGKWSKQTKESSRENDFLKALLNELPSFAAQASGFSLPLPADKRLEAVTAQLSRSFHQEMPLSMLSELSNLSQRSLERIFKKETGLTLGQYQQMLRIQKSLELLSQGNHTISQIAHEVGYNSVQAFSRSFRSIMQTGPAAFVRKMR